MPETITPELIQEAARGNSRAFRVIVETHQGFVYTVAHRFVSDEQEAEDITQDVFVRLWKNLGRYRHEVKLTTWLHKIVTNRCLDFLSSRHGRQRKNRVGVHAEMILMGSLTPEAELQQQELTTLVHQAAEELTPKQRAVFILRDLEGLSAEETSQVLGMPPGNVKSNLFHARQKVLERLKRNYHIKKEPFL